MATELSGQALHKALAVLRFTYPVFLLIFLLAGLIVHSICLVARSTSSPAQVRGPGNRRLPRNKLTSSFPVGGSFQYHRRGFFYTPRLGPAAKSLFNWLSLGVILTLLANAVAICIHALAARDYQWWCGQAVVVYVIGSFFFYCCILISLVDTRPSPTLVHFFSWLLALGFELVFLVISLYLYDGKHRELSARDSEGGRTVSSVTGWEAIELIIDIIRIALLVALLSFYILFAYVRPQNTKRPSSSYFTSSPSSPQAEEHTALLDTRQVENGVNGHVYGGVTPPQSAPQKEAWSRPDKVPSKSWWEYIRGYSLFFPYLWPAKSTRLQLIVVVCFLLVIIGRVINILVPYQVGLITDILADEGSTIPWSGICLYIFYRFLQGGNGLIGSIRSALWVPISQYSYQELSTAAFEHVHGLSLDFHLSKKTGEVISALSKGNSINTFLEQVTFQVVPMLVDLGLAIGYFLIKFDAYYALVISIVSFIYLYVTVRLAQWRSEIRREMVNFSRQEDAVKNDSLVSYETVKYFNAEDYEFNRYRKAVRNFQDMEYKVLISLNIMNVSQNTIFTLGLLVTCFIAAYQVTTRQRKVGDFTALVTYMAQLQAPLNFFGTFYRSIQFAMINAERMLELFKEQPSVMDDPKVRELSACQGDIVWKDVEFSYDKRKPALDGVTFRCEPGTTTALVGESGGGKSTIFRLLFRFYNAERGSIRIDNQDVRDVTIDSFRRHIGVVPQDTVLFNESVMYNLKYARPAATDEEVYAACRAASIHDKILSFPDGYDSLVGDRGLKLSGGEKQRVAIARAILKDPRIILLDEATAALDTETEQHIQEALKKLSLGRTTLVIAHRLSTITTADQILVLHAGQIVERGTHAELLGAKGRYASMWKRQVKAQKAADAARAMTDHAEKLRMRAQDAADGSSQSEDDRSAGDRSRPSTASQGPETDGADKREAEQDDDY